MNSIQRVIKKINDYSSLQWKKVTQWAIFLSLFLVLFQFGLSTFLPDASQRVIVNFTFVVFISFLVLPILWYTARQTYVYRPQLYPSWLLLLLALCCNPLSLIMGIAQFIIVKGIPYPSIIDYAVLIFYPLMLGMVALLPSKTSQRIEIMKWTFDAIVIGLSSAVVFWNLANGSDILNGQVSAIKTIIFWNTVGDMVLFWAMLLILFKQFKEQKRGPIWWLFGSLLFLILYDFSNSFFVYEGSVMRGSTNREVLLSLSLFMIILSALQQLKSIREPDGLAEETPQTRKWETLRLMMPYLGVSLAFGILIVSLASDHILDPVINAYCVAIIVLMIIARQYLVIRENQRLNDQLISLNASLEMRVELRTSELIMANQELSTRETKLVYNTLHDTLTNLPNRALLFDRLDQAIRKIRRDKNYHFAVFFMDLDRFKVINDSLGHLAGDRMLIEVGRRLSTCVREIDTIARLGGDEFVLLLEGLYDRENLLRAANRVLASFSEPFEFDGQAVYTSASMGIVTGNVDYELPSDILRDADIAMYEAKSAGKTHFAIFTTEMQTHTHTRLMLEKDLRIALERQEFTLVYQPILRLASDQILGFEALLRWKHPTLGMVSPATFIPIAESNGLIVPITAWVIRNSLNQIKQWQTLYPGNPPITVSVNLSARLFAQLDLLEQVERSLIEVSLPSSSLVFEITESAIISDRSGAVNVLNAFQKMGIKIHMDDFGTGYSSLSYLHQFPIDTIKIDQTFISNIQPNGEHAEILRAIVTLAKDLKLSVIAEGVETLEQLVYINQLSCEGAQGYFISPPLSEQSVKQYIIDRARLLVAE
jgi:diguanylate cyclase (GGDEF)-like protein